MPSFDVLILGAGIVGAACALECTKAGLHTGIVEPKVPGGGATAAGMGHIVVMDDSPAQLALSSYSQQLWREMESTLPQTVEYEERGTLWVAADDDEMAEVHAKQRTYAGIGIDTQILDSNALAREEPHLRQGLAGGLLVPRDSVVYPPAAAAFFLNAALRSGAVLLRGKSAVAIGAGMVLVEEATRVHAERIIVATGADRSLVPSLPMQRRKGHLVITDRYPGFVQHQLVELGYLKSAHKLTADSVAFNVQPRQTGQLLIGSSRQYGNENAAADHTILREMLERAQTYMPALAGLSAIRVWTGFRAATPDKLPYIGAMADPSVFLAMGFEGLGITNALGAARLVVDQMLGRRPAIDPTPFLPSRVTVAEPAHA